MKNIIGAFLENPLNKGQPHHTRKYNEIFDVPAYAHPRSLCTLVRLRKVYTGVYT
jgi:hypothetical protein